MLSRRTFRDRFGGRCAAFAVVHVDGTISGLHREVDVAASAGMDGVFLIDHREHSDHRDVLRLADSARASYPEMFLGVNWLDLRTDEALVEALCHRDVLDAVWCDDAHIGDGTGDLGAARMNASIRARVDDLVYFGGVAFKYQPVVADVARSAAAAAGLVDVLTTSGDATGHAPDRSKIETIRAAAPDVAVAIASGVTPENLGDFVDLVDAVLVATGISQDMHHLDSARVRDLVEALDSAG